MQFQVETRSLGKYDIIVAGGGIAGSFAAASAAREGAKVVLVYKKIPRPFDVTKMGKNGHVTTEVLVKICTALDCTIDDIMEIVQE